MSGPTRITRPKRGRKLTVPTGSKRRLALAPMTTSVVEMEDLHFNEESAVVLPDFRFLDPMVHLGRANGLSVLRACFLHAQRRPDQKLMVVGHADTHGSDAGNQKLSLERADSVHALLANEKSKWAKLVDKTSVIADYQIILRWVAKTWAWPCDPGRIDGERDDATKEAVKRFQRFAGHELAESITVDGIVGEQTWGAVFDIYRRMTADLLAIDLDTLDQRSAALTFLPTATVGCGESFPMEETGRDGFRSALNRRVELFFFDPNEEPIMNCHPSPSSCLKDQCELHNSAAYLIADIGVPPRELEPRHLTTKLVEVTGLYKPGYADPQDKASDDALAAAAVAQELTTPGAPPIPFVRRVRGSGYEPGYTSQDDCGRIFVNHEPRTDPSVDWQDIRKKDKQYVELTVKIAARDGSPLPGGIRVNWRWIDPDDASDNSDMHDAAAKEVDAETERWLHTGDDNIGKRDWPKANQAEGAAFEEMPGFGLIAGTGDDNCHTAVVDGESKLRLHVTNVAGDNFRVEVELRDYPLAVDILGDTTGVMTVWKRIDLEYREMEDAVALPVAGLKASFAECFVQMDVHCMGKLAKTRFFAKDADTLSAKSTLFLKNRKHFEHRGKPGWFCLISAIRSYNAIGAAEKEVWSGEAKLLPYDAQDPWKQTIEIPAIIDEIPQTVTLTEDSRTLRMGLDARYTEIVKDTAAGTTRLRFFGLDVHPDFPQPTGDDTGFVDAVYAKTIYRYTRYALDQGGTEVPTESLGFGENVRAVLHTKPLETGGISPSAGNRGRSGHFAGQTIVFSRHPAYELPRTEPLSPTCPDMDELLATITHELGHGFGFPHKCGYHAADASAENSCTMNYGNTWLYEPGTRDIVRFRTGSESARFCARHIRAVRSVHLEDNKELWSWK